MATLDELKFPLEEELRLLETSRKIERLNARTKKTDLLN